MRKGANFNMQQHDDRALRHTQSIYLKCYAFNLGHSFTFIINISNQQSSLKIMQNTIINSFSQNQTLQAFKNASIPQKIALNYHLLPTDINPNKFSHHRLFQMVNLCQSDCQLIINYPESQEHGDTVTIEEESSQKDKSGEGDMGNGDNCIDIDSIMNPSNEQKLIPCFINTAEENNEQNQYSSRDETKNIPKNYIKAVFSFILENPLVIKKMFTKKRLQLQNCEINKFLEFVRMQKKSKVYTIGRFKQIWLNENYGKMMRIIYAYFMRKHSLHYIYSSKIENKMSHVKHRVRIFKSLEEPQGFSNIK